MARLGPAVVWGLARAVVHLFYRVERLGPPLPEGPLLLVGNHPNGLLDPAVVATTAGRAPRFLAKSSLFTLPVVNWFVTGAASHRSAGDFLNGVDAKVFFKPVPALLLLEAIREVESSLPRR